MFPIDSKIQVICWWNISRSYLRFKYIPLRFANMIFSKFIKETSTVVETRNAKPKAVTTTPK